MEKWKFRLDHDFEVELIQCRVLGLHEPTLIEGGFKRNTSSKNLWRRFKGEEFWKLMEDLGHTSIDFDKCDCCSR